MNYIKEINALYDRQEQTPLSGSAVTLWYALMHINNKTRWKNTFTSPASVLKFKSGLTDSSFKRARAELVELGYIEVKSQGRGRAPIYTMNSLVVELKQEEAVSEKQEAVSEESEEFVVEEADESANERKEEHVSVAGQQEEIRNNKLVPLDEPSNESSNKPSKKQVAKSSDHTPDQSMTHLTTQHADHLSNHVPAPLYKQYINKTNTKQNNIKTSAADELRAGIFANQKLNQTTKQPDAILFYQENFGIAGPFVAESLLDWINSLGEELVIEALKRALERGKTSWGYVKSILKSWFKKGIRTVSDAKAEQVAFENKRKNRARSGFNGARNDDVPEWYEQEKQKERERERNREKKEVTQAELEEAMRRYWEGA